MEGGISIALPLIKPAPIVMEPELPSARKIPALPAGGGGYQPGQ